MANCGKPGDEKKRKGHSAEKWRTNSLKRPGRSAPSSGYVVHHTFNYMEGLAKQHKVCSEVQPGVAGHLIE